MIDSEIKSLIKGVVDHPVYSRIITPDALKIYMQRHVYFVLDFMFLVKSIQNEYTNTSPIWFPRMMKSDNAMIGHYINEIVTTEETDVKFGGKSHLEYYIEAMKEAKADTSDIESVLCNLKKGTPDRILDIQNVYARDIFRQVCRLGDSGKVYAALGVFAVARENIIPEMFTNIVKTIDSEFPGNFTKLRTYLDRHIELDSEEHGPMSSLMLKAIPSEWEESARIAIKEDLTRRFDMLNSVYFSITNR